MGLKVSLMKTTNYKYYKGRYFSRAWFLVYAITFLVVLPLMFADCNHSLYFTLRRYLTDRGPYVNYLMELDKARLAASKSFLDSAAADQQRITTALGQRAGNQPSTDVIIAMVTVARNPIGQQSDMYTPEYVTETVGRLISQLVDPVVMKDFPYSVKIILCNGGMTPSSNKAALHLSQFVKLITVTGKSTPRTEAERRENEKIDYMTCLNESLKYQPRYVLALEDDAFAKDDMWKLLNFVISEKLDRHMSRGHMVTVTSDVAYVKLIHPECKLGYHKAGFQHKLELLGLGVLLGTPLTLIHEALLKYLCGRSFHVDRLHVNWLAWCIFVTLVVLAIGRPCIVEMRRYFPPHFYSYSPAAECCIPALLYPRHGAKAVIQYLNETRITRPYGKDTLIDFMLPEKGLTAYQLLPNAFSHIGQKSSGPERDPYCVH